MVPQCHTSPSEVVQMMRVKLAGEGKNVAREGETDPMISGRLRRLRCMEGKSNPRMIRNKTRESFRNGSQRSQRPQVQTAVFLGGIVGLLALAGR